MKESEPAASEPLTTVADTPEALIEAELPATRTQTRLLVFQELSRAPVVLAFSILLTGRFSASALADAIGALVRDHDVLRSGFEGSAEHRRLVVWHQAFANVSYVDLSGLSRASAQQVLSACCQQLQERPLAPGRPPLMRVTVALLRPGEHLLHLAIHHALVDEASMRLLIERLAAGYLAASQGNPIPRHSSPPFHQLVSRLNSRQGVERLQRNLQFWTDTLDGCPAEFSPPKDREPSGRREMRASRASRRFRPGMSRALDDLAAQWAATRFGVLAASLALLLARLVNSRDVVFAISVSLRHLAGASRVVGPLMNTLVLRVDLTGVHTLRHAVTKTMESLGRALAHSDTPLDAIYSAIRPEAAPSAPPFAQVLLSLHGREQAPLQILGLEARSLEAPTRFSPYHLSFTMGSDDPDLIGTCDYLEALYDEPTVAAYLEAWEDLLLTGSATHREPCKPSSAPTPGAARPDTLLERLAYQRALRPDAVALVDAVTGEHVSHRQLDCMVDEVARGLCSRRLGIGRVIGIHLSRGPVLWATLLGVLKAGHACAPLRLQDSRSMLKEQIQSGGIEFVIDERHADHPTAEEPWPVATWLIGALRESGRAHPRDTCRTRRQFASMVLSTSGSTGRSKWVELPLAALDATLAAFDRPDLLRGRAKMLSITDATFDISWLEIFGTLYCGGTAVIAKEGVGGDGAALARAIREHRPDVFQATPYTWARLMSVGWFGEPGLRGLCGGEAADPRLSSWLSAQPMEAINVYGPTESNIWSMASRFVGRPGGEALGEPLPGEFARLLSDEYELTPPGGIGELFVGGAGLAHGYRADPARTARVFVPDPGAATPGARLYKTGDVVRRCPDGALVFRGRTDAQVKLRGFRVELEGVARRLADHPAVQACVVSCREDRQRGPVLVAYLKLKARAVMPELSLLHQFARERLPAHAVPAAYVSVKSFPVTTTQKVDRRRLPAPELTDFPHTDATLAPRSPTEEGVAMLWAQALGHGNFGVDDDFFALGGTSLRAVEVTSRLIERMSPSFTFAAFLDAPTVAGIARRVDAAGAGEAALPPIRSGSPFRRVALSEIYRRRVLRELRAQAVEDVNVRQVLPLKGAFNAAAFEHALRVVSARHSALRLSLGIDDAGAFLMAAAPSAVRLDLRVVDLIDVAGEALAQVIDSFVRRPFDLRRAPLFRFALFRVASDVTVLAMAASHLVVDGWSLQVLARDIGIHYRAACRPVRALPLPVQFTDYVAWQDDWIRSEGFAEGLRFWMRRVLTAPPALFGQTDGGLGPVRSLHDAFGVHGATLLSTAAQRLGCTPYSCALGCTLFAMRAVSGLTDLAVLTAAANRADPGVASLVGLVMNPVVVRVSVGVLPLREMIAAAWREVCAVNRHQGIPIDLVYDALASIGRRPAGEPAQLHVLWNERGLTSMQLPGVRPVALAQRNAAASLEMSSAPALQLWFAHGVEGFDLTLSYRVDLIADDQADQLLSALRQALEQLDPSASTPA